jgi:hypothetical protein
MTKARRTACQALLPAASMCSRWACLALAVAVACAANDYQENFVRTSLALAGAPAGAPEVVEAEEEIECDAAIVLNASSFAPQLAARKVRPPLLPASAPERLSPRSRARALLRSPMERH